MVTPTLDRVQPRLHPLSMNWTARAWWVAGQALNWVAAAGALGVLWVIPNGGLGSVSATVFWGSCVAVAGAFVMGLLARGAQWQAWAEVPGAHAAHSVWSKPRFEYTWVPDLLSVVLRYVVVAGVGVAIAAQSDGHAALIGAVGALAACMAVFRAAQEVASRAMRRESVKWTTVALQGIGVVPGAAWCLVGNHAGVSVGATLWVIFILAYVIWKMAVSMIPAAKSSVAHG